MKHYITTKNLFSSNVPRNKISAVLRKENHLSHNERLVVMALGFCQKSSADYRKLITLTGLSRRAVITADNLLLKSAIIRCQQIPA